VTSGAESESGQPKGGEEEAKGWKIPSLSRFGEYIKKLLELEGTVASLKAENKQIRKELGAVSQQVNEQSGQLKVLADFVRMATNAQVEAVAAKTAMKTVESMVEVMRAGRRERE
jgi:energy-coupling factor transporter ATP-binding protein EcfA2